MTRTNTAQYLLHGILYGKVVSSTFCKSLAFTMLKKYCCLLPAATKLGQGNIFTSMCQEFCPGGGGEGVCLSACWDTPPQSRHTPPPEQTHHPPEQTPLDQADPTSPPGADTPPRTRQTPLGAATIPPGPGRPPRSRHHPPREADSSIRSTSGQYASYWNAFLLNLTSLTK